jgi:hypothetical protein
MGAVEASLVVVCMPRGSNQLGLCDYLPNLVVLSEGIRQTYRFNAITIATLPSAQISGR